MITSINNLHSLCIHFVYIIHHYTKTFHPQEVFNGVPQGSVRGRLPETKRFKKTSIVVKKVNKLIFLIKEAYSYEIILDSTL